MKKLLCVCVLLAPASLLAQSAFDGTWRLNLASGQFSGKDELSLSNGVFRCDTCDPKSETQADGQDHELKGSVYYDTTNVREIDDRTVEVVNKKKGRVAQNVKLSASEDGKVLTTEYSYVGENGEKGNGKYTSVRLGDPPAAGNKISGAWQRDKVESASDSAITWTFKSTADGLTVSDSGTSCELKFDGKDYPCKMDPGVTTMSLRKIDTNTIVATDKRAGKVVSVSEMKVAPDGKTMTIVSDDKLSGKTEKWTAQKQ